MCSYPCSHTCREAQKPLPVAAVLQPHRHKAGVGTWRSLSKVRLVTAGGTTFVSPQYVYRIFLSFPFQNSVSTLNRHFIRYAFQVPFISILLCTIWYGTALMDTGSSYTQVGWKNLKNPSKSVACEILRPAYLSPTTIATFRVTSITFLPHSDAYFWLWFSSWTGNYMSF